MRTLKLNTPLHVCTIKHNLLTQKNGYHFLPDKGISCSKITLHSSLFPRNYNTLIKSNGLFE